MNEAPVHNDELVSETRTKPIPETRGGAKSRRPFFASGLFLVTVVVPTFFASLYFGVFASDVYISEARFVVRSPARQTNSPLGIILNAGGFAGAGEEASAVLEYVRSRDALNQTDADRLVTKAFSAPAISWFDRFGTILRGDTREHLFDYYLRKVSIENDSALQVTRLSVSAFTAEDAREINCRLLRQAESLVNRLSERARDDAIRIAAKEVRDAQGNARSTALALSRFRGREGILDPGQEAGIRLQMVSKLQDQLVAARTQLQQLLTFTPQATQIPFLRSRIQSLEREIAEQTGSIAGGQASLSSAVVKYQQLRLENDLAEKQQAAAFGALEEARAEARRKRAYVERISQPSLPDYAREPRRSRSVLAVFILGLLLWGVLSALVAGVREHQD